MKTNRLKKFRIGISLFFLILIAFLFIDFSNLMPDLVYQISLQLQFVPGILHVISGITLFSLLFVAVIILTLLFGRVYCSTICPLGTLQDVISYIGRKTSKKRKIFRFKKEWYWLRYGILSAVIISYLLGFVLLINLLDPYTNFGKIFSVTGRPVYAFLNNNLAGLLAKFDNYSLYAVDLKQTIWPFFVYPTVFLITVGLFSFFRGRLYCNSICPVGTLLGLISKTSLYKISIVKNSCSSCARCAIVCKSGCIDFRAKEVDFSRCVGCFNCLKTCPDNAIGFRNSYAKAPEKTVNTAKRAFLIQSAAITAGTLGFMKTADAIAQENHGGENTNSNVPVKKTQPVVPPGGISIKHFTETCTACQICVSACPMHVLQPSVNEYGWEGFMQPTMDFWKGYCNFECTKCTRMCPTGALRFVGHDEKKTLQLGKVNFIKENCIVDINEKSCGACAEHCPTSAVIMVPYKGQLTIPETNQKLCIGCGACECVCPARPNKAIYVDGNTEQLVAEKPVIKKQEVDNSKDFPF